MKLAESPMQIPEFGGRLRGRLLAVLFLLLASAGAALGQATLQITTTTLPGGVVGVPYAPQNLTATGGTTPYGNTLPTTNCSPGFGSRWCVVTGSLPAGLSLSTVGTISGTPTTVGTASFVVELHDSGIPGEVVQKSLSITVAPLLAVTTTSLPNGIIGTDYVPQTLTTTGGTLPNTWAVISGSLPSGMNLSTAGTITGIPTVSGRFGFTVRATDSSSPPQTATQALTIAVPPLITTVSLPNGAVGANYSQPLTVSPGNAPFTWALVSGTFPPGLNINTTTGFLSGIPTAQGTSSFTVSVTDSSSPPLTGTRTFFIAIQPGLTILSSALLPQGIAGVFYTQQLVASGPTPITWSLLSGTLPPGLQITSTGSLVGTPNVAQTFSFVLQAAGGNPLQTAQQTFSLTINPALNILTTSPLPGASLGAFYSTTFTATGGVSPYIWTNAGTTLPPGLILSGSGVLSGTPTRAGTFSFGIQVTDSFVPAQQVLRTFSLTVSTALTIATTSLPNGEINKAYTNVTLVATAGTPLYTWSVSAGALPSGMSLASDGTLGGTPVESGTFDFTVRVDDSSVPVQTATRALTLIIQPALVITTASPLPTGQVGVFYSKQISVTSGQTSLSWTTTSGGLPPGVNLTQNGLLVGTPQIDGIFDFTVRVSGTNPVQTAEQAFRIVVIAALNISTISTLPDATLGINYSFSLVAAGGTPPYTWTNPGRSLPAGLSLSPAGVISGIPSGVGTFSFTVQVADSFSPVQAVSRTFTLSVNGGISITTLLLPNAIQNLAYTQLFQAVGGQAPLTWVVSSGTLPAGLILGTNGLIQGIPTGVESQSLVIMVTDARGISASKNFTLTVDPPIPAFSTPGMPKSLDPTQSSPLKLSLATPFPSALSGVLTLSFVSKAEVAGDDPQTRFSTGLRTVTFTIPANGTAATFPSAVSLLTGTVAGTVTFTATLDNSPSTVLPVSTVEIAATAPQITNVTAIRTSSGLEVQITGYSATRRVTTAEFTFDVKVGSKVQQVTLRKDVDVEFSSWYRNPNALAFGSAFSFVQTFDVAGGDTSPIMSVTVRLTNPQGGTASQVIPFK